MSLDRHAGAWSGMAAYCKGTCSDRTYRERIIFLHCLSRMIHSFVRYLAGQKRAGVALGLDRRSVVRFQVGARDFCIYQNVQIDSGGSAKPRTSWIRWLFLQGSSNRETKLTTRLHLLPSWCKQDRTDIYISNLSFPYGLYYGR